LALGWIGESVVAELVITAMASFGYTPNAELAHGIALPIAFIIITFLHIVLGELAPKSLAIQRSEAVALGISIPLKAFYILFRPFIWALNSVANLLLALIGIESVKEQELHSAEELRYLIEESSKSGMIELNEQEMIENVFVFQKTMASEIMIPRGKIIGLEISMNPEMIVETVIEQGYSRMPVYEETLDNIIGIVYAKDILTMMSLSDLIVLQDIVRPVTFIQETDKIHTLLTKMQKQRFHMAVVLDEFGGTAGLVTLEDIMEELVGEIQDEYDEEKPIVESKNAEEWTISADASIADVNEFLPYPFPESEEYQTVGGMINHISGRIPSRYSRVNLPPFYICMIDQANTRKVESVTLKVDKDKLFAPKD